MLGAVLALALLCRTIRAVEILGGLSVILCVISIKPSDMENSVVGLLLAFGGTWAKIIGVILLDQKHCVVAAADGPSGGGHAYRH